jgi:hypothetical protein
MEKIQRTNKNIGASCYHSPAETGAGRERTGVPGEYKKSLESGGDACKNKRSEHADEGELVKISCESL